MTAGEVSRGGPAAARGLSTVRATRELRLRWITGEGRGLAVASSSSCHKSRTVPAAECTPVSPLPAYVRRRGCLCRLPGRTVTYRARLGRPPSFSEGRGDRGGKRTRLRGAEAA